MTLKYGLFIQNLTSWLEFTWLKGTIFINFSLKKGLNLKLNVNLHNVFSIEWRWCWGCILVRPNICFWFFEYIYLTKKCCRDFVDYRGSLEVLKDNYYLFMIYYSHNNKQFPFELHKKLLLEYYDKDIDANYDFQAVIKENINLSHLYLNYWKLVYSS